MKNSIIYICIVIVAFVCTPVILFDIFLNRDIDDISKYKTSDDRCIAVLNKDGDTLYKLSVAIGCSIEDLLEAPNLEK